MADLKIRVPSTTHRIAALAALRYQQAEHQLDDTAVRELAGQLGALAKGNDRQELLDALVSLGSVAAMLQKLGDASAHAAVMRIIATQAHHFEDLAAAAG